MAAQATQAAEAVIEHESQDLATRALAVRVANNEQRLAAAEMGRALAAMEKRVGETFDPICEAAHKTWKEATTRRASFLDPLTHAKRYLAGCIGGYDQEMERRRRAEQERLDREQRERETQEAALRKKEAEDRQLAEAQAALEIGEADLAEAIITAPTLVELPPPVPVIVQSQVAAVEGVSSRQTWKWRLIDISRVPREFLALDETKINGYVRSMKGAANIPGIEAYPVSSATFRS